MFQSIIWDFDGTLVDTYPAIARAVNTALAAYDKQADLPRVVELTSISLDHCIKTLAAEYALPIEQFDARFEQAYLTITPTDQPPFPGILPICEYCVATNRQAFIVTHRRNASLHQLLTTHQLNHFFTDIVAGDDGFARKPDPSACLYLIDKHHLDHTTTLLIGDRDFDVVAGQRAGIKTCLFGGTFLDIRPDFTITTFDELYAILG